MTIFAVGTGAAFILVSFTQSLWFFYMTYALLSVTTTGIGFIPVSRLLTRWFVRRRGTAIGLPWSVSRPADLSCLLWPGC